MSAKNLTAEAQRTQRPEKKARKKNDAMDLKLSVSLPIRLQESESFPNFYHEIGTARAPDGRQTKLGLAFNMQAIYVWIGDDRFAISMEKLANELIPRLLEFPTKGTAIDREHEGLKDIAISAASASPRLCVEKKGAR